MVSDLNGRRLVRPPHHRSPTHPGAKSGWGRFTHQLHRPLQFVFCWPKLLPCHLHILLCYSVLLLLFLPPRLLPRTTQVFHDRSFLKDIITKKRSRAVLSSFLFFCSRAKGIFLSNLSFSATPSRTCSHRDNCIPEINKSTFPNDLRPAALSVYPKQTNTFSRRILDSTAKGIP